MKHAILILAYNNPDYLNKLVDYFDDNFLIYIHIDRKSKIKPYEIRSLKEKNNVALISRKYKIFWGGFNILKAELYLLTQAMKNEQVGYFHMLSGQDMPIKSIDEFIPFFDKNTGTEFLEYATFPRKEWENGTFRRFEYFRLYDLLNYRIPWQKKLQDSVIWIQNIFNFSRKIPNQFPSLYGGSAWFSLSRECIKYVLEYTATYKSFYNRLKYTFAPEEVYFPTVIMHSPFKEKVKNNNLRYILWRKKNNSFPAILDKTDFFKILESDGFFARKIDPEISRELIFRVWQRQKLKIDTLQKYEANISEKGYWKRNYFQGHCYDTVLGEALCLIFRFMEVKTIVDLGCGPGWYVKTFRDAGFQAEGFDGNPYTEKLSSFILNDGTSCSMLDLTEPIVLDLTSDVVLSLEVAEHIPKEYEDLYIANLVNSSKKYIVLSWAEEGQKGEGHINCRNNEYVIQKLKEYGYMENVFAKNYLRKIAELHWFKNTILVFQK